MSVVEVPPALEGPRRARAWRVSRSTAAAFLWVCAFFLGMRTPMPLARLRLEGAGASSAFVFRGPGHLPLALASLRLGDGGMSSA